MSVSSSYTLGYISCDFSELITFRPVYLKAIQSISESLSGRYPIIRDFNYAVL